MVVGAASLTLHPQSARAGRRGSDEAGFWACVLQLFAVDKDFENNGIGPAGR